MLTPNEGRDVPIYEYRCGDCGVKFEKLMSMAAALNGVACPGCGGESRRQVSTFAAHSKSASGQTTSVAGGGGCAGCAGGSCAGCQH